MARGENHACRGRIISCHDEAVHRQDTGSVFQQLGNIGAVVPVFRAKPFRRR